jgi:hypothetical protein
MTPFKGRSGEAGKGHVGTRASDRRGGLGVFVLFGE